MEKGANVLSNYTPHAGGGSAEKVAQAWADTMLPEKPDK
jgi:hypothetical protein